MNIILFIICILLLGNAIRIRNDYVNYYHGFDDNIAHFIGTFLWCCTEEYHRIFLNLFKG